VSGERITVECAKCGRCFEDWTHGPVDLEMELDPDLADPGFIQAACTATCPHCGCSTCLGSPGVEPGLWRVT
jgi:hypothetical protein